MSDKEDNVIRFPKENRRLDVSNISMDIEEIAEEIRLIKLAYFNEIADELVDNALRSMSMLNLEDTPNETFPIETKDIILLKETFISMMARIVGLEHPLHNLSEDNIVLTDLIDGEDTYYHSYHFKTKEEKDLEIKETP